MRRSCVLPIALYAVLAIAVIPVFPHFASPNELSRWAGAVAIVDDQSLDVSRIVAATGLGAAIEDLSAADGRLYSNKAPGSLLLAVPAYAVARIFTGAASAATIRPTLNAMRIAAATIPAVLLAFLLMAAATRLRCEESRIRIAVVVLLFATPLFAYGILFFAHALSAFALFGAWMLFFTGETRPRHDVAAGALIGLAVVADYPNVIPAAVIGFCALPRLRVAGALHVAAGGLPFAAVLAVYNLIAFGTVFTLSSAHESNPAFRELARSGLFGIGLPSPENVLAAFLDPSKGLLILSPVLVIAVLGLGNARRAMSTAAFIALLAAPLSLLLLIAGYPNWHGGWTVGARYLVAALPFAALLVAFARETAIEAFLLGASIAVLAITTLVFPFIPPNYAAPWMSFSWPLLANGLVAPNLFHFVSTAAAVALPVAVAIAALALGVRPRRIVWAALGVIVWFTAGWLAARERSEPPFIRAFVEEVHFSREGAIREVIPTGPAAARLEAMARETRRLPPPDWPF